MSRFGVTPEEMRHIYKIFTEQLKMTREGAIGFLCNLDAESDGFVPNRVEYLCRKRLREAGECNWSDSEFDAKYTAAVDSGTISREKFANPLPNRQYGYGLAQWTTPSRKGRLYLCAKKLNKSIGSIETAAECLKQEMTSDYVSVLATLQKTRNAKEACAVVLRKFECPADSSDSVVNSRYARHTAIEQYLNSSQTTPSEATESKVQETTGITADTIVATMESWVGLSRANGTHKLIIDLYNSHKPLARGYKVTYSDEYCDTTVSAAFIKHNAVDLIGGTECGVEEHVKLFSKKGIWKEDGAIVPERGWIVVYNWDKATQPNDGYSDHIGIVQKAYDENGRYYFDAVEGNMSGGVVGIRKRIPVGWGYIRGFAAPGYATSAAGTTGSAAKTQQSQVSTSKINEMPTGKVLEVTADKLNVRRWAGTEYPNIKSYPYLAKGNKIDYCDTVKAADGTAWYFVRIRKQDGSYVRGFISSKYVKESSTKSNTKKRDALIKALEKMQTRLLADIKEGKVWRYRNPSSYTRETWSKALKDEKLNCNCALLARWALKEAGIVPTSTGVWYGKKGGTISASAGTRKTLESACELIHVAGKKTAKQLITEGTLKTGDIVTYVNIQHTNIYAGDGVWYDAGHAYCSGTGEGAVFKSWRGNGKHVNQKVAYIIRVRE
ncbi:MAG: phage tail tip lysozyme [Eubacteriales bacterium]|nr:phage tail tip lysozyme [Eubacteriales bacterium]